MKIIKHDTILKLGLDPLKCYEWVGQVIENKDNMLLPAKMSLKPRKGVFYNIMPSILPGEGIAGVKIVNRYPNRAPSLDSQIMLYDLSTGMPRALLDGNYITAMRTGAVAAHSIKLFAAAGFSVLGFIGLGNTARAALKVLLRLYPQKDFTIRLLKYKEQSAVFQKEFSDYPGLTFVECESAPEVIEGCDVIVSAATYFDGDICEDRYFKKGCLLVPIHTRGFTNCDLFFDKVYADDTAHVSGFGYFNRFKRFAEVSDVVNGRAPGREHDDERILVYNIGISVHDIYFAGKIEKMVEACEEISLEPPAEKFWV